MLQGLLVHLLSHLEGISLSVPSIHQTLSNVPLLVPTAAYDISISMVQKSSMVPPHVDSLSVRLTISLVTSSIVIYSDDYKRFQRFILLGPPKFNGAIVEDPCEFFIDLRRSYIIFYHLIIMEFFILPID